MSSSNIVVYFILVYYFTDLYVSTFLSLTIFMFREMTEQVNNPGISRNGMFVEVKEHNYEVGKYPGRTIEVTIMDSAVIAGLPHENFKRQFSAMTGTPMSEIKYVFNYGEIRQWFVTIISKQKYEALNMKEYGTRRQRGEQGERFKFL